MDDLLALYAEQAGRPYGMTASEVLAYIVLGDRLHDDARPGECGAVDPRDEARWCREPEGHAGPHSPVASPPGMCGVLLPPYDPYTYCRLPVAHLGSTPCSATPETSEEGRL
ncbi:hypothetical protein Psi01_25930 [Planobispora siamensis]|uniref:Uncharacterized protein n=2 Tax=Planobispora siamensis TaxID=936338 RepID=A0A8J3SLV1_9ACTN|nr:hypothetical protein Psi01_25930 [Planobispora siamensis]